MISIIIPLYNQADKISDCLWSIKNQTYSNYEILLVNDRSTDRLSKIVDIFRKEFGYKIKFYHNQEHHGAPYSRNKGFRYSKGEFVFFCDADSVLKENALEIMLDSLRIHNEASYAYPNHKWGHKNINLFPFDAEKLKKMPYIHTMALIRREHFPKSGWDENIKKFQDWDLWLSMLNEGRTGVWINQALFTIKPGGTMSSWLPSFCYKIFPFLPAVKKYNRAFETIKKKYNLE
ncbi:hypothetical protein DRH27_03530 [Candidatus Falkowbacteria bacterium]|nr:MAG: hypothetical protein DRH27_03530 [Candidatus Falkowbacteria bacterium]